MKNKIISIILVFSLILTIVPATVFAKTSEVKKQTFSSLEIKKPSNNEIKKVGTELEYYKQQVIEGLELVKEEQDEYITYSNEVAKEINDLYQEVITYIVNATKIEDIFEYPAAIPFSDYAKELKLKLSTLDELSIWDTQYVSSPENLVLLKEVSLRQVNIVFKLFNKKNYNDYYWSIFTGNKTKIINKYKNIETFRDLAAINAETEVFINDLASNLYFEFNYINYEYDDNYGIDFIADKFEESNYNLALLSKFGIVNTYFMEPDDLIYTNADIKQIKENLKIYISNYVTYQLKNTDYQKEAQAFADAEQKKLNNLYNVSEIYNLGFNTLDKLIEMSGIEYKDLSTAAARRLASKIENLYNKYIQENTYTEETKNEIDYTIAMIIDGIMSVEKEVFISDNILTNVQNYLEAVPTEEEELLQEAKNDYIYKLSLFKNNVKYNQTKVVPIVNEGIAKIKKATTITNAKKIYINYYNKAKATIKKFTITTKRVGKGTITKSKTVTYGSNFTVAIKPNKGYKISKIYVDGKKVKTTSKYTFKKVTKKHTIKAVFVKK